MVSYCFLSQAKIEKKRFPLKWKLRKTTSSKHTRDVRFLWFPVSSLWRIIFKNKSIAPPTILHTHDHMICTLHNVLIFLKFLLAHFKEIFSKLAVFELWCKKTFENMFLVKWFSKLKCQFKIILTPYPILHWPIFNEFSSTYFWLIWNMMLFHDSINKSMHAWRLFRNVLTQLNWNMYLDFAN